MKTTNNYEAPIAEMIEMEMPVVLTVSGQTQQSTSGFGPGVIP
jgi:hypothetical protein